MKKADMVTGYLAKVGAYTASNNPRGSDRQLLQIQVELGMDGAGGWCSVELAGADFAPVQPGEAVHIKLDGGQGLVSVFTGAAEAVETTATTQRIKASDALTKLARIEVEAAYAEVHADFIIKDLLSKAGAKPGTVAKGPNLPSYLVHRGPRALGHLRKLAQLCGADLYTDGAGAVHCAVPRTGSADHSFNYGENIIVMALQRAQPAYDSVEVWGEGAASSAGADKAHWLCTDLSGVSGKAALDASGHVVAGKLGKQPIRIRDGAIRSGGAAQDVASARMTAIAAGWIRGRMEVFGTPAVMPGDLIGLKKLPATHAASRLLEGGRALRVRSVRHVLDRERGFVTRLEF